ncbi:MAG: V-type ATP synthase subunit D [Spirochaetaceae bacterium]
MAKVKLTKNELKKQKDALKRFQRYLPTLMLKKQQLQMVIRQVESQIRELEKKRDALYDEFTRWIAVFGEDAGIESLVKVKNIERETGNIAGVDIPVFKNLEFEDIRWDLFEKPLWVDRGVEAVKKLAAFDAEIEVLKTQLELLSDELRITTQRVNLFEKVMIPDTKENIRRIQIYLGDQQTAAVVRGKMAKNKIAQR